MNCRLHNSLSALLASGATLAIVLALAAPAGIPPTPGGTSTAIPRAGAIAVAAHASPLSPDTDRNPELRDVRPEPRASRAGTRHRRHIVVMPYFSFSPRG